MKLFVEGVKNVSKKQQIICKYRATKQLIAIYLQFSP